MTIPVQLSTKCKRGCLAAHSFGEVVLNSHCMCAVNPAGLSPGAEDSYSPLRRRQPQRRRQRAWRGIGFRRQAHKSTDFPARVTLPAADPSPCSAILMTTHARRRGKRQRGEDRAHRLGSCQRRRGAGARAGPRGQAMRELQGARSESAELRRRLVCKLRSWMKWST
ncbi:hypothetical protein TCAP_07031 [Tolypocladium capitatum]|uniref:Uncharacterized protein n=1 Tax=Tolypocladium capitatum TaxID=45235 RepID=A0A2K3Q617_9HYPO|nr:hypothetical protein TCAP_07031 [Tolypocladium capitatum]